MQSATPQTSSPEQQFIGRPDADQIVCTSCTTSLPIQLAGENVPTVTWKCTSCGSHYDGLLPVESRADAIHTVVFADQYFHSQPATLNHEWADALVDHLQDKESNSVFLEKRAEPRFPRNRRGNAIGQDDNWICHIGVVRNGHARWLWADKLDAKSIVSAGHASTPRFFTGLVPGTDTK